MTEHSSESNLISVPQEFKIPGGQGSVESGLVVETQFPQPDRVVPVEVNDSWTPNPESIARASRLSAEEVGRRILELRKLRHSE